jgi:hypothetical protein
VVIAAVPQGLAQGWLGLAEGHEGIQLAYLLEKLLQLGFSHRGPVRFAGSGL